MPENDTEKNPWLDRIPELEDGKRFPGMNPADAAKLFDDLSAAGQPEIAGIIDTLREIDDGTDWKSRFLLHALVSHAGHSDRTDRRRELAAIYAVEIRKDRPATVKTFLIQQLQGIADSDSIPVLVDQLGEKDPVLVDAAAAALTTIGGPAAEALRKANEGSEGHAREAIDHALAQID